MRKLLLFLVGISISQFTFAQSETEYEISTDRPSVSYSANVLPRGIFQSEIGFVFTKINQSNSSFQLPNISLRYGILNRVELRIMADYALTETESNSSKSKGNGFLPLQIGTKINFLENKAWLPSISVLGQMAFPKLASEKFQQEKASGFAKLLFENDLGKDFSIFYNAGVDFADSNNNFSYSGGVGKSVGKTSFFTELFGSIPEEGENQLGIDGGISYSANQKTQLDCAFGVGLNENSPNWFGTIGFSFWLD